jgi:hypothetical protein
MGVAACRPSVRLAAAVAGLFALALSFGAAQARSEGWPADTVRAERGLLANGDFADGLHGWAAHRARLSLVRRGPRGAAVRVSPGKHRGRFFIFRAPRPVRSTTAATMYIARAWARPSRAGQSVCLRVQQVVAGRVARKNRSCFSGSGRWRVAQLRFRAAGCTNGQVGVSLTSRGAAFEVDAISLVEVSAPNLSVPNPSLCQKPKQPLAVAPPASDLSYQNPFPAGSIWNSPLPTDPAVHPQSAAKIAYWLTQIRWPNLGLRHYATAVAVAAPTSPTYPISCTVYACPDMNQFGPVPIPAGTRTDPSPDGHLAVWDPVTRREWDFWISGCPNACHQAGGGGSFSTATLQPWVTYGANATDIPLLAGIVHPEEIKAGRIDHPLIFGSPNVGVGHVCPAAHSDGRNAESRALQEGTLLQLDPALDVSALSIPAWQKTIARAMQRYGMYLTDGGGSLSIGGENPINRGDLWAEVGLMGDSILFDSNFPWARMRVLTPPKPWC